MKKIVLIVLAILLAASLTLTFTACKNNCAKGEHDMQLSSTTEATCTADKVEHYKCANCTHTEDRAVADTKLGHDFANGSVVTETPATCKGAGSKTVKCARCNETQTSSVGEATNHSYKTGEYHNANDQHWQECEYNCGTTTQKTDCTYTYAKKDATHHTATCSVCHNSVDKPHSWVKDGEEIAATCEHGTITNYKCVCGQTKQEEADDKLNHEFTQDVATVSEATCTAKAVHTFKCAHCKQTENREVGEMLPHTYTLNKFSNTEHWKECQCGAKTDVAAHVVGALVFTDEHVHYNQCTGCEKRLNEEAHAHNVYDKTVDGHTSVCKCGRELSAVQPHTYDDDDVICNVCGYSSSNANFVVKINGAVHEYETITAAFASVKEGDTALIVMGKDVYGDGVDVPGGRNITWRLNGHTYTVTGGLVGSANTVSNCVRFLAGSNITILNGTITADESLTKAAILVQNYADLTLNNVTLDASNMPRTDCNYALSVNNGRVQLIASTLKAASRDNAVALDLYYGLSSQYTKVEVLVGSGCTLIGAIEYGSAVELDDLAGKADLVKPRFNNTIRFYGYAHCGNANIVIGLENGERLTHDAKTIDGIDATCTEDGLTEGSQCARCGKILVEQQVIPANGHDWNEWQDIDGTHMRDCKNCDAMQEHVAAMSDWSESDGKHFHSCTVDGCTYSEQHAIEWELYDDTATCTQAGIKIYICMHNGCDCEKEEDSPVKPHEYELLEVKTPATCTENAVETYKCKHCEATEDREKENSALGHDVTTADYVGNKQHTGECTRCHTVVTVNCSNYDDDKAAACTVCGHQREVDEGTKTLTFSEMGYSNAVDVTSIVKNGITIELLNGTSSNTPKYYNTGTGIRIYGGNTVTISFEKCNITKMVLTFSQYSAANEMTSDIGNIITGNNEITWTGNGRSITFTVGGTSGHNRWQKIVITYEVCGHYWDDGKVTSAGDCETDGEIEYTCLDCGAKKTEVIPAGHNPEKVDQVNNADGTITKAYWHCERCNKDYFDKECTREITDDNRGELTYDPNACEHLHRTWKILTEEDAQAVEDVGKHAAVCDVCGQYESACDGEIRTDHNEGAKNHTTHCTVAGCGYPKETAPCDYDKSKDGVCAACGHKGLVKITFVLTNVEYGENTVYIHNGDDSIIALDSDNATWVDNGTTLTLSNDTGVDATFTNTTLSEDNTFEVGESDITITIVAEKIVEYTIDVAAMGAKGSSYTEYTKEINSIIFTGKFNVGNSNTLQFNSSNSANLYNDTEIAQGIRSIKINGYNCAGSAASINLLKIQLSNTKNDTASTVSFEINSNTSQADIDKFVSVNSGYKYVLFTAIGGKAVRVSSIVIG